MEIPQAQPLFLGSHKQTMRSMVNRLYEKYSSSQDYYFSRDINDIIAGNSTSAVIRIVDYQVIYQ
jgi:hypothetical protein